MFKVLMLIWSFMLPLGAAHADDGKFFFRGKSGVITPQAAEEEEPETDPSITLSAASLPSGKAGEAWSFDFSTVAIIEGIDPSDVSWSLNHETTDGEWLQLDSGGIASGYPENPGTYGFEVVASGAGLEDRQHYTIEIEGISFDVMRMAANSDATCAITSAGALFCWGNNNYGQLGTGNTTSQLRPVPTLLTSGVSDVVMGNFHSCALTDLGEVLCWGNNGSGEVGIDTSVWPLEPTVVPGLPSVKQIAAGGDHTCAVTDADEVMCWGDNRFGQLGDGSTVSRFTPRLVPGLPSGVEDISAGNRHTCAVTSAGGVFCWGENVHGQLGNGTNVSSSDPVAIVDPGSEIRSLASAALHTCALSVSGEVFCWGSNSYGQLGDGTNISSSTPRLVVGLDQASRIDAGTWFTCAQTTSGEIECWGDNSFGQLGDGSSSSRLTPGPVPGLAGVAGFVSGSHHNCAYNYTGEAFCWGYNASGGLGDGTKANKNAPVQVIVQEPDPA